MGRRKEAWFHDREEDMTSEAWHDKEATRAIKDEERDWLLRGWATLSVGGWWWAPKMDNYLGSFNLLIWLNPPFSLVYCMFLIIFMLIEWIWLVIMPTSLMGALCSLFGQLGDKIEGFNEHLAAKFVGEQARGFVGRCPPHLWTLTSNCPPSARS